MEYSDTPIKFEPVAYIMPKYIPTIAESAGWIPTPDMEEFTEEQIFEDQKAFVIKYMKSLLVNAGAEPVTAKYMHQFDAQEEELQKSREALRASILESSENAVDITVS